MNRVHIAVIIFGSALLLFLFQNCQKPQLAAQVDGGSNSPLTLPNLDYKYKKVSMSGTPANQTCLFRCLNSSQITLDLENSKISFIGHWTTIDNSANPPTSNSLGNTDIELNLSANDLQNLRAEINQIGIISRTLPDCDNCAVGMGSASVLHKFTDYNDLEKSVYLYDLVDPSLSGMTVNVYDSTEALNGLVCKIKNRLESSNLSPEQKTDLNELILLATRLDATTLNCL